ncbi:MAG: hypothetical protein HY744_02765 [Deltaproteobacteria bacterium]|nr:hypothetical protein [Deltaproteobacteria bacterium]
MAALAGCGGEGPLPQICSRPESADPTAFKGGKVQGCVYQSAPWDGELLHFPGGAYYQIFHQLGVVPSWWLFYLSFERDGVTSGSISQAAGNEVEVKAIDAESITVLNGTCAEYWMLARIGAEGCAAH